MTTPHNPEAPEVILADSIPASAGSPAAVPVQVRHRGRRPARIRVTIFGLDSRWVPQPLDLGVLQPGDTAAIKLSIVPERGAMGARYPFTIAAEASSVDGRSRPVVGVAESVLALDAAERISMAIVPSTPEGAFSKGFRVEITNPGEKERTFTLVPDSAAGVTARLSTHTVTVPPERTVAVKGRVHVKKPTIFGGHNTHTFTVAAQGTGAPEWAEGTMRSKPLVGKGVTAVFGLIMVVALWATLAIVFIPKISNAFKPKNEASVSTVQGDGSGDGAAGAGDGSGSGDGSSDGSSDGSGDGSTGGSAGGDGSGDGGSGTANGGHPAGGYQLSGTVTGSGADGATVILAPVSLASAGDDGSLPAAQSVGSNPNALRGQGAAFAPAAAALPSAAAYPAAAAHPTAAPAADPIGKIPGPLAGIAPGGFRTTTILTTDKGEFTFSGVTAPGFYLLTLAKAGYQTQRFLINSATLASPQPLKVELQPGKGKLSGMVTGPGGSPLGAATIVVTDGTVTLQTSSVSASTHSGTPGSWTLDQVSTPGTYLVTASSPGLGAASTLVSLDASGSATVNLSLQAGQTSITGKVSGADSLGNVGGLGGITVTATDGDTTRTATTVTSAALRGAYVLPNLPTPGSYTLTISGAGFLPQTREVNLPAGSGNVVIDATLFRSDSVVTGRVTGLDANGKAEGGLAGVGLTLASNDVTLKTMSTSGATAGSFQFTGVAPGSYVLTAVQFGRTTASATVEVTAAKTQTVNLVLKADIGAELPATAHIRGQVADSRTGGPLTCDRALETVAASDCVATVTVTAPKDPADESKGTVTYTTKATAALNFVYTIPDLDDPDHAGLPPGLYTVTVKAPGYEDTVTHVQVAEGQTMPAPPASMPPLGIISGTVTTRVGTPAKASCVLAVPVSVSLPKDLPTSCAVVTGGDKCTAQGISGAQPCALTSMGGKDEPPLGTFTVRGLTHGKYQMVLISQDAEYVYTVGTVPTVNLELGADGQFNAVLDRLGRIELSIQKIDPATGQLVPEDGATISIADSPTGSPRTPHLLAGAPASNPVITQLAAGAYFVTAKAMITPPGGTTPTELTATGTSAPTGLNQTVSMTLVIANRSGAIIGRVISNVNNVPMPVAGTTVSIIGTVVSQSGTSSSGSGSVTTDANGCFAIVPDGWTSAKDPELTSPVCPNPVPPASQATMAAAGLKATLISDSIKVAVAAKMSGGQALTDAYPSTDATIAICPTDGSGGTQCGNDKIRIIPNIPVSARPLQIAPTLDVVGPAGFSRPTLNISPSPVVIDFVSGPTSAGTVTLRPTSGAGWTSQWPCTDSGGTYVVTTGAECSRVNLTFTDSKLGTTNTAAPGVYQFSVSVAGFNPTTIYLLCEFGRPSCVFVANVNGSFADQIRLSVMRKPELSANLSLPVTDGKYATDAWTNPNVQVQQTAGTTVSSVAVQPDAPTYDTVDPSKVIAINAHLTFSGQTTVLAPNPGNYTFEVSGVRGYNGATKIGANCGVDFTDPCVASPPTPADPYPTFDTDGSTVALDQASFGGQDFDFADISATVSPNPGNNIQLKVTQAMESDGTTPATDADGHAYGHVTWTDSTDGLLADQTIPRSYTVVVTMPGFEDSASITVDCTSGGACSTGAITLKRLPAASGTVTIPLADGATSVTIPANAVTVDPVIPSLQVSLGSPDYSVAGKSTWKLVFNDSASGRQGLVQPHNYTVTIAVPGYEPKTLTCDATGSDCTVSGSLDLHPQPAMKLTILPDNDTAVAPQISADLNQQGVMLTSDIDGNLTWKQDGPDNVVTPRATAYVIRAALAGYEMSVGGAAVSSVNFTCDSSANCTFPTIVLTKKTDLVVKLVDSSGSAVTSNARISLNGTSSNTITTNGSATFAARSTTGVTETGGTWSDGGYTLSVNAAGYLFVTGLGSGSSSVSCTDGGSHTLSGMHLFPGGTTTCTVTLTSAGAIIGTTVWDAVALQTGTAPAVTPLTDVTLTAEKDGVEVTAKATAGANGNGFTLTGMVSSSGDIEGLTAGEWTIDASPADYEPLTGTVTIGCAAGPTPPPDPDPGEGPDANGYCTYGYVITGTTTDSASKSYLSLSGQAVVVHFVPTPVKVTVTFGSLTSLPPGSVTLTSTVGGAWTCSMPAPQTGQHCPTPSGAGLTFEDVPPGDYTLSATFSDGKYSSIVNRAITVAAGIDHTESLPITARINTVSGFVTADGNGINGATVQLCNASACPAKNFGGTDTTGMSATTATSAGGDDGAFSFTNVADGAYYLKVTHAGFTDKTTGYFNVNFDDTNPQPQNVTLTPKLRQTLSLTFDAPTAGPSLTGAAVKLIQTGTDGRPTPTSVLVLTGSNMVGAGTTASPYTSTLLQVPTGTYLVTVNLGSATAPFEFPAGNITVDEGADTKNVTGLSITFAKVTFSVTPDDPNQTLPADVPFTLSNGTANASPNPQASRATNNKSADADLYLPPGSFKWQPALSGAAWDGWSATAEKTVTVSSSGTVSGNSSTTLDAPTPTVTVTVQDSNGTALDSDKAVTIDFLGATGEQCTGTTGAGGVIPCTGLDGSKTYGVTATWTDDNGTSGNATDDTTYVGYNTVTTDPAGFGAVDITLQATPSALISIKDGSGAPAGGASVDVFKNDGTSHAAGSTDAAGNLLVTGLTDGDKYYAFASKGSLTTQYVDFEAEADSAVPVSGALAATVSLTVTVTDKDSAAPLGGVAVGVIVNNWSPKSLASGTSATATGEVEFTGLPAGQSVDISASKSGYADGTATGKVLSAATNTAEIKLKADGGGGTPPATAGVTLKFEAPSGTGVAATVTLAGGLATFGPSTADPTNGFTFTGLTPNAEYAVTAAYTDTVTGKHYAAPAGTKVTAPATGTSVEPSIVLDEVTNP